MANIKQIMKQIEGITNDFESGVSSKGETNGAILALIIEVRINTAIETGRKVKAKEMRELLKDCESYAMAQAVFYGSKEGGKLAARCKALIEKVRDGNYANT